MNKWRLVTFGDILTESKVVSENSNPDRRITVRLNVKGVEKRGYESSVEGATKYFTRRAGQFIYGKQNLFKGAFGIVPAELDGLDSSSDIPAFDVSKECVPEWIIYFLKQGDFYKSLEGIAKGTGSRRIHAGNLFKVEIPLPTVSEQKDLLRKIRKTEEKYSIVVDELNCQQSLISQLRQSILQEAVQGKLVKQNKSDESASELLKRINIEKEKLITQGKLKKEKPFLPIDENEPPFKLPKGWVWCRMGEIVSKMEYGTSEKSSVKNDIPVLGMGNIQEGKLVLHKLKYVSKKIKDLPKLYLKKFDLIFNRTNSFELVGKSAIFLEKDNEFTLASYLIRVAFPLNYVSVDYVTNYINSNICRKTQIEPQITQQTGQANFSGGKLKEILFPLPPFSEQIRIVEKVNQLMQKCEKLEQQVQQSVKLSQQLMQTLLREVFENKDTKYKKFNTRLSIAVEE